MQVDSLAARRTPVAWEPEVGVADAPDFSAATGGDVVHSRLLVLRAVRSLPVSLSENEGFGLIEEGYGKLREQEPANLSSCMLAYGFEQPLHLPWKISIRLASIPKFVSVATTLD